jgi:hypothetical protein
MSGGWDSKQDYDEGRAADEMLREEIERVRREGRPLEFEIEYVGPNLLDVWVLGGGELRLTTEQARQLGSALLAEVEIATRKDIE